MIEERDERKHSPIIYTDESRLMQVLLNLQANAIKFTPQGGIKIICTIIFESTKKFLEVQVIDTGVGISEENQKKLFKLFGFVSDTEAMNTKGIGLGLSIALQIVQQFQGTISVKSKVNEGSNFTFRIRLENSYRRMSSMFSSGKPANKFCCNSY